MGDHFLGVWEDNLPVWSAKLALRKLSECLRFLIESLGNHSYRSRAADIQESTIWMVLAIIKEYWSTWDLKFGYIFLAIISWKRISESYPTRSILRLPKKESGKSRPHIKYEEENACQNLSKNDQICWVTLHVGRRCSSVLESSQQKTQVSMARWTLQAFLARLLRLRILSS